LAFSSHHGSPLLWLLAVVGAGMTAFYMFRQFFMVFFGKCRADRHTQEHLHESPRVMTLPLVILAVGALFAGWIGLPAVFGGSQFAHWLEPVVGAHAEEHPQHALELGLMAVSVCVAGFGFFVAYLMYYRGSLAPERFSEFAGGFFYRLFDRKYFFDEIYQVMFVNGTLLLARIGSLFDQYIIDGIVNGSAWVTKIVSWINGLFDNWIIDGIVNAIANLTFVAGDRFRKVQTGNINSYLYVILGALLAATIVKLRYWS
jgi:NADH-quinone oxidoreductase subunit L